MLAGGTASEGNHQRLFGGDGDGCDRPVGGLERPGTGYAKWQSFAPGYDGEVQFLPFEGVEFNVVDEHSLSCHGDSPVQDCGCLTPDTLLQCNINPNRALTQHISDQHRLSSGRLG